MSGRRIALLIRFSRTLRVLALSSRAVVWRLPLDHATRLEEINHLSYNIVKDPMHIRDLNATILNLLGMDHERLTFVQPHAFHWVRKPLETD